MGAARALFDRYLKRETEFADLLRTLRTFYHSLHAEEREEVVDILGQVQEPDAVRELMQLYSECQWRTTRFQIIRALSHHPAPRSLEFLMSLAKDASDVPLCEAAIWALGQSRSPRAGRYLVHLHAQCPASVLPFVVGALGQVPDHTLQAELLVQLHESMEANETLLTRALVSTLSQLRTACALPLIVPLQERRDHPALARMALLAVGKLSRDVADIRPFERAFDGDAFAFELAGTIRTQILLRSQWSTQDLVAKIFSSDAPLAPLAQELNLVPASEVRALLEGYTSDAHFKRLCWVLSLLNFAEVPTWYVQLFAGRALSRERIFHVLESMQSHESESFFPFLEGMREKSQRDVRSPLFEKWFEAAALCLPRAESVFEPYMESHAYLSAPTEQKVTVINHFVNFALCIQSDASHFDVVCRALKGSLLREELPQVRARLLRAFGQLEYADDEIFAYVKNRVHDIRLAASALFYVERARPQGGLDLCLEIIAEGSHKNQLAHSLLRAMTEQPGNIGHAPGLDGFLKRCLAKECLIDLKVLVLGLLARQPRRDLLSLVVGFARAEERLQLAAVVALKNYADETAVDALTECLRTASESVVGRALDSLTTVPGVRAKAAVLDYLEANISNLEIVDKIVRCLGPTGVMGADLSARVERLIQANPNHPMIDGLFLLKERLNPRSALALVASGQGLEVEALDKRLAQAVPQYETFDEDLKAVLRAAELPFASPEMFAGAIDKSSCVIQYCKALDMRLERTWGKERLFPALEKAPHIFQNIVHAAGLAEETPSPESMIRFFGLAPHYTRENLPLAKIGAVARGIVKGRMVGDHWRIFDGLRAWAVVLALFGRPSAGTEAMLSPAQRVAMPFALGSSAEILKLSLRLLRMQETRSLAVHRQTFLSVHDTEHVRTEALAILGDISALV